MSDSENYARPTIDDYAAIRSGPMEVITESFKSAESPQPVADTVMRILKTKKPKFHYRVGKDTRMLPFLQFAFNSIYEKGAMKHFKI